MSVVAAAALLAVCSAAPQYYYPPYAMYAAPYPAMYPYQGYPVYGAVSPDTASSRLLTFSSLMSVTGKMEATGTYTVSGTAEFQQNPLTGNNSKYSVSWHTCRGKHFAGGRPDRRGEGGA